MENGRVRVTPRNFYNNIITPWSFCTWHRCQPRIKIRAKKYEGGNILFVCLSCIFFWEIVFLVWTIISKARGKGPTLPPTLLPVVIREKNHKKKVQFSVYASELHSLLSLLIQMLRRKEIGSSKRKPVYRWAWFFSPNGRWSILIMWKTHRQNWVTALTFHNTELAYVKSDVGSNTGSFKLNERILFLHQGKENCTRF